MENRTERREHPPRPDSGTVGQLAPVFLGEPAVARAADRHHRGVGFQMIGHRRLGQTRLAVPECTIGTSGWKAGDPAETRAALALALDNGITAIEIDAGDGERVGEILKRERGGREVQVFSRVTSLIPLDLPSPHIPADYVYPGRHIRAETEALLSQLGVERLALQQLHA